MIAACPTCAARYRIDASKLGAEGARLRCGRCETVFRVRAPEVAPATPVAAPIAPAPVASPPPTPTQPVGSPQESVSSGTESSVTAPSGANESVPETRNRERLVLVAHSEVATGKAIAETLGAWGLETLIVQDGVEAILNIQRALPRLVILDAALPKMFGFQVCEIVKRNESLRSIHVVLVGAIHDQDRYRRPPADLYGADAYVEPQDLPDALRPIFSRLDLRLRGAALDEELAQEQRPSSTPPAESTVDATANSMPTQDSVAPQQEPPPTAAAPTVPAATPEPSAPSPASAGNTSEMEQAERLARIIVSDILLYNPEKFSEGLRSGDVVSALRGELEEGRSLFTQRVDPRVGNPDEFLQRELVRIARERGMAG